jgi:hypothetical protein
MLILGVYKLIFEKQETLQQQGAILRSKYHRKQQKKMFPKSLYCEP